MVINNQYKFLFIHVPKAAGTSITAALGRVTRYGDLEIGGSAFGEAIHQAYHERFGLEKHSTAAEVQNIIGMADWHGFFTFAFVRNPFLRACSAFEYARHPDRKWLENECKLRDAMRGFQTFAEFVHSGLWDETDGPGRIFMPQTAWTHMPSPEGSFQAVDFVGSAESIDVDLEYCAAMTGAAEIGTAHAPVPLLNRGPRHQLADMLTPDCIAPIIAKYAVDFEAFGYSTDPLCVLEPPLARQATPSAGRRVASGAAARPAFHPAAAPGNSWLAEAQDEAVRPLYEELDLSAPLHGTGWYEPERDGHLTWRWTGPTRSFTLGLPLKPDSNYELVLDFDSPEQLRPGEFTAQLNHAPLSIELAGEQQARLWSYTGHAVLPRVQLALSPDLARLKFDTARTQQVSLDDDRLLGVVVRRLAWRRLEWSSPGAPA